MINKLLIPLIALSTLSSPIEADLGVVIGPPAPIKVVQAAPVYKPSTVAVVNAISLHETNRGKTGVGKSKNNPTGIRCPGGAYCSYPTLEAGYAASCALWDRSYSHLGFEDSLARWKVGNPKDRSPATLAYIAKIKNSLGQ